MASGPSGSRIYNSFKNAVLLIPSFSRDFFTKASAKKRKSYAQNKEQMSFFLEASSLCSSFLILSSRSDSAFHRLDPGAGFGSPSLLIKGQSWWGFKLFWKRNITEGIKSEQITLSFWNYDLFWLLSLVIGMVGSQKKWLERLRLTFSFGWLAISACFIYLRVIFDNCRKLNFYPEKSQIGIDVLKVVSKDITRTSSCIRVSECAYPMHCFDVASSGIRIISTRKKVWSWVIISKT